MQTKHLFQKRLTSILLAGVLMASPAAVVFGESQAFYPPKAHSGQTLRELPCTGVDGTQLWTLLGEFELLLILRQWLQPVQIELELLRALKLLTNLQRNKT